MRLKLPNIKILLYVFLLGTFYSCGIQKSKKQKPDITAYKVAFDTIRAVNDTLKIKGSNSLRKNQYGQWEYVGISENPLDLGTSFGALTQGLIENQEEIFFSKIKEFVPTKFKQNLLKKYLAWYNRNMYQYVLPEYQTEIYGLSRYLSNTYDEVAPKYLRSLYLHGAHDIGHAVQNMINVGCTSFAAWGNKTKDGHLIMGRNFDFYVNDDFARDKIVAFIQPEKGYRYLSVTWAGMLGVVSGMNQQGLCVTINAARSKLPMQAKTPISLVTKEILQYAKNIEEAIAIAKRKKVFVSESILVGSALDNRAVILELSPNNFDVYDVQNTDAVVCSNHFQGDNFKSDKKNERFKTNSHSNYRLKRMWELIDDQPQLTVDDAVKILRNKKGLNDIAIGYGNEKAINQLLAHHGIVFSPHKKMVWVSSNPYTLGDFVAFQMDSVFNNAKSFESSLSSVEKTIGKDEFLNTVQYANYEKYRQVKQQIEQLLLTNKKIAPQVLKEFVDLNPDFWEPYDLVGQYYLKQKDYKKAQYYFEQGLQKEVTTTWDKKDLQKRLKKVNKKLHDTPN